MGLNYIFIKSLLSNAFESDDEKQKLVEEAKESAVHPTRRAAAAQREEGEEGEEGEEAQSQIDNEARKFSFRNYYNQCIVVDTRV